MGTETKDFESIREDITTSGFEIGIVKVCSPGEFIVNMSPAISVDQERNWHKNFKAILARRLISEKRKSISQHASDEDEIVAVQQNDNSEWRPFLHIQYNLTKFGDVPEGIFLDNGHHTEIKGHRSVKLPCEYDLPIRFRRVILNNLVSTDRCGSHATYPLKRNTVDCVCKGEWAWSHDAVNAVRDLCEIASTSYVIPEKAIMVDKMIKIFGSVILEINGDYLNLADLLICNSFARLDEERFLQLYPDLLVAEQQSTAEVTAEAEKEEEGKVLRALPMTEEEFESTLPDCLRKRGSSALEEGARSRYKSKLEFERTICFNRPGNTTMQVEEEAATSTQETANNVEGMETGEPCSVERGVKQDLEGGHGQLGGDTLCLVNKLFTYRCK